MPKVYVHSFRLDEMSWFFACTPHRSFPESALGRHLYGPLACTLYSVHTFIKINGLNCFQTTAGSLSEGAAAAAATSTEKKKSLADIIDISASSRDGLNMNRKRKAALEQGNILKKIKKRTYQ